MMDPAFPFELPPARSAAGAQPALGALGIAAQALTSARDLAELERIVLAFAVHPDGLGFERAYVLRWNARSEQWAGRVLAEAPGAGELGAALEGARLPEHRGHERVWQERTFDAEDIGRVAAAAWDLPGVAVADGEPCDTPWHDAPAIGALAIERDGQRFGLLVGTWRHAGACDARRDALEALRRVIGATVAAVDRSEMLERRARQSKAVAEMAASSSSPGNLGEVLGRVTVLAAQGLAAHGSALWLAGADRRLHLEVTHGVAGERERLGRALQSLATAVVESGRPRAVTDTTHDFLLSPETAAHLTGVIAYPLMAFDRTLGALAVYRRQRSPLGSQPAWSDGDREFVQAMVSLAALAIEHAARFREVAEAERRAGDLHAELVRLEGWSTAGERAMSMVPEARQPLSSIQSFARKLHSALGDGDPRHDYVEIILTEVERLDHALRSATDQAPRKAPALHPERINDIVHKVLQDEAETLVRRRVRLVKKLAPDLPAMLLDGERIRHAIGNMLKSALESVAYGGRIRLETRRARQYVVVEVAHDGGSGSGGALEKVFEPFESNPGIGGNLALGAVERIIREHGGEVRVRSEGDWSTVVAFTLPVQDNQDRRRCPGDRRQRGGDRRRRFPER